MATRQSPEETTLTHGKGVVQLNFRTAAATRQRFEQFKRQRGEVVGRELTMDEAFQDLMETVEGVALLDASEDQSGVGDRLLLKRFLEGVTVLFLNMDRRLLDAELLHRSRVSELEQQTAALTEGLEQANRKYQGSLQAAESERQALREELQTVIAERDRERTRFGGLEEAVAQLGDERTRLIQDLALRDEKITQIEADTKQAATAGAKELRALRAIRDDAVKRLEDVQETALADRGRIARYAELTESQSKELDLLREEIRELRKSEGQAREEKARIEGMLEVYTQSNAEEARDGNT